MDKSATTENNEENLNLETLIRRLFDLFEKLPSPLRKMMEKDLEEENG